MAKFGEPHPQYKGDIGVLHEDDDEEDASHSKGTKFGEDDDEKGRAKEKD